MRNPTIRDIAREAGVSTAAVSRVLHGSGGTIRVSEKTADHIRKIATNLQYVPNLLARNLREGKTKNIGLVFEHFGSISAGPLYYAYMLDGITSVLFENRYRLTILPEIDTKTSQSEINSGQLDGLIWCKVVDDEKTRLALRNADIPIVAMNSPANFLPKNVYGIGCDNESGAMLVIDHLVSLGHTNIAFLGEVGEEQTPDYLARRIGFEKAMAKNNLPVKEHSFLKWGFYGEEFKDWHRSGPQTTAIFAWNEGQAGNLLNRAREAGVAVPNELSIVGFDSTSYCDSTTPTLTAVRQPIREMAQMAARSILELVRGNTLETASMIYPCTLDVRGSTQKLSTPPQSGESKK